MGKIKEVFIKNQEIDNQFPDSIDDEYRFNEWNLKSNQVKVKVMIEFHQTMMGKKFYESDVPRLVEAVERVAKALESKKTPSEDNSGLKESDKVIKTLSAAALEGFFSEIGKILDEYAQKQSKIK